MKRLREEAAAALFALQLLTRVPIPAAIGFSQARQGKAVGYYPLVGVLIGAVLAAVWWAAGQLFPEPVSVLLSITAGLLLTGAMHEDGLADTVDGLGGGNATAALSIMRDSRIGVFGALALVSVLSLKAAAMLALPAAALLVGLVLAHALSRLSLILVVATSRYAGENFGSKPTAVGIGAAGLALSLLTGLAVCALAWMLLPVSALASGVAGLTLGHGASRLLFERKLGGYTGDCLGATQQLSELGVWLGLLAAL